MTACFFSLVDGGLSLKFVCPHQVIVSSLTLKNCGVLWLKSVQLFLYDKQFHGRKAIKEEPYKQW